jgi:hypothetical protein
MKLNPKDLEKIASLTLDHYDQRAEDLVVVGGVAGEGGRSEVEDHLARFYAVGFQRVHIADDDLCSLRIAPLRFSSKKDAQNVGAPKLQAAQWVQTGRTIDK